MYSQAKALVAEVDYTPYGQAYTANDTIGVTHRYTGHDWDASANLYFAPYRFYNPQLARWMSRDPLGMVDGPNLYAYVSGRPITYVDPDGRLGWLALIALLAAALALAAFINQGCECMDALSELNDAVDERQQECAGIIDPIEWKACLDRVAADLPSFPELRKAKDECISWVVDGFPDPVPVVID